MIITEATRCKIIVNDLLNFSRQNEVLAQDTDLNALLQELANEKRAQELFGPVELVTEFDPSLPSIQADPLQLRQVFLNLMNNAAEAMLDGGSLTLRTRKGPSAKLVTVEIQDTGIGIPKEHMKKIFTPFFTTKPIGKGTGLGLAIIYGIVKMHHGQINVESKVGEGTTFSITLREHLPSQVMQTKSSFIGQ
jgi:signal transduction histidine kinase